MGYAVGTAVSAIVHNEGTALHILLYLPSHVGIGVARGSALQLVCVPHHLFHVYRRSEFSHLLSRFVGICHMYVGVSVVAHKHHGISPVPRHIVRQIAFNLVYECLCLVKRSCRQSSHCHVGCAGILTACHKLFAVVKHHEEVVGHEAFGRTERVFTLEASDEIHLVKAFPVL